MITVLAELQGNIASAFGLLGAAIGVGLIGFKAAEAVGRNPGASGKVPAAIHVSPEAADGGPLALLRDGDLLRLDATTGRLDCLTDLSGRSPATPDLSADDGLPAGLGEVLKDQQAGMDRWRIGLRRFPRNPMVNLLIGSHAYALYAARAQAHADPAFSHPLFW